MRKVLLIEDDFNLAFLLRDSLENEGFDVFHLPNGEEMMAVINDFCSHPPDIILLDVNLGGIIDGFELSRKIRQRSQVPIIFTTGRTDIEDVQEGFKIGNVDYLKKPFGMRELVLRMNELLARNQTDSIWLERTNAEPHKIYQIGKYMFNPMNHCLKSADEKIHLQKNECTVLKLLCKNKNQVLTKNEIMEAVWPNEDIKLKEASLHNILSSLRTKLSKEELVDIHTIPKTGYQLVL